MVLAPGQPIPHGRPYRYQLNRPVHMMTARKRVGPLPTHRLAVIHSVDYSSLDHFSSDDSSSSSSSETSSDSPADVLSDSASSRLSFDHSLPASPSGTRSSHQLCSLVLSVNRSSAIFERPSHDSSSASRSRKRSRSHVASVPLSSPTLRALSYARAYLLPSPKRIRSPETATDLEDCSEDRFEPYVPREVGLGVDFKDESSEPSRSRGADLMMDYCWYKSLCCWITTARRITTIRRIKKSKEIAWRTRILAKINKLRNRSRIGINKWYQSFALRNFDLEVMEFESAHGNTTAKLPILKLGEYEMWVIRIKQHFQIQDYALWEVINNGNSWVFVPQTAQENGTTECSGDRRGHRHVNPLDLDSKLDLLWGQPSQPFSAQDSEDEPWSPEEEVTLCKAWVDVSKISLEGNAKWTFRFWSQVVLYFDKEMKESKRGYDSLNCKWKNRLRPKVIQSCEGRMKMGSGAVDEVEMNYLQVSLADINLATQDFSHDNLIGEGGFGRVYRGKLLCAGGHNIIAAKRLNRMSDQGETELNTELVILSEYKHMNVIDLVSYCNENGEKVIVYDYAARGSLDKWLKHKELTWRKRLEICIDIARGLEFLHGTSDVKQVVVIHRDIKSANILLHDDWKASIADFGLSLISPINQDINYVIDNVKGTRGYCDPLYMTTKTLTKESDIYSLGVLLFEMLCGRFVMEHNNSRAQDLVHLVRHHFKEGTLYEMVFAATKKQMAPNSLTAFRNIAYQCIHEERSKRPTAYDVLIQLKKALEHQ
ncbi:kinase RLK-Pelle-LRR-I-1 family protein [Tanacetum coccineum]